MRTKTHNLVILVSDTESAMVKSVARRMGMNQSQAVLALIREKDKELDRNKKRRKRIKRKLLRG